MDHAQSAGATRVSGQARHLEQLPVHEPGDVGLAEVADSSKQARKSPQVLRPLLSGSPEASKGCRVCDCGVQGRLLIQCLVQYRRFMGFRVHECGVRGRRFRGLSLQGSGRVGSNQGFGFRV